MKRKSLVLALVLVFALVGVAEPLGNTTDRISISGTGAQGTGASSGPAVSSRGQLVAFVSGATNLIGGDTNRVADVFVRDRMTGSVERVSVRSSGGQVYDPATGTPAISADGRYVAWETVAAVDAADTNRAADVYVRDRVLGATRLVSRRAGGGAGNGTSYWPAMSDDGRYLAFSSLANNLAPSQYADNLAWDVFLQDTVAGTNELISVAWDGGAGDGPSLGRPALSADGRYVAFLSTAGNLLPQGADSNGAQDIFVRDRLAGTTERVSVSTGGQQSEENACLYPDISADGRYVVFASYGSNLVAGDTNGWADVFLHDRVKGTTERINVAVDGGWANGDSCASPVISADGRFIAYVSHAGNLVSGDSNGLDDLFVYDRTTASTWRASIASNGDESNGYAEAAAISPEGYWVAFSSRAANLVPGDNNGVADVFVRSDSIAPTTQATLTGTPGRNDWFVSDVQISLSAADDPEGYGLDHVEQNLNHGGWSLYNGPIVADQDGNHLLEYRAVDVPGNVESAHGQPVRIDRVPPTITFSTTVPAPNTAGWNRTPVELPFAVTDATSGPAEITPASPLAFPAEGLGQSAEVVAYDVAGNSTRLTSSPVNIDLTAPGLNSTRWPYPNAHGWNNTDVTVTFAGDDLLSGLKSVSEPAVLSLEAAGQAATGRAVDVADNTTTITITNINIDKTAPVLSGAPVPPANANGWNNTPVTMVVTATDTLSGVDGPDQATFALGQEGRDQSVQAEFSDLAGNVTRSAVGPINIDLTAPLVAGQPSPAPNDHGWNNTPVAVLFTASDALSGIDGPDQTTFDLAAEGPGQAVQTQFADRAGNVTKAGAGPINIDLTAPALTYSRTPPPNRYGWNFEDVTVFFTADDALSGLVSVSPPVIRDAEAGDQTATGVAVDLAGNVSTVTVTGINIDKTPPVVTRAGDASPVPNAHGWNNTPVAMPFRATDSLSGIEGPEVKPFRVWTEGRNQYFGAEFGDLAGNVGRGYGGSVNIDMTPPTVVGVGSASPAPNASGWNNGPVTMLFRATDALSGVDGADEKVFTLASEGRNHVVEGEFSDLAGNVGHGSAGSVNIDMHGPLLTSSNWPPPNANGWNSGDVTVSFSASDWLSGLVSVSDPVVLTAEQAAQTATGQAVDAAGNITSLTVTNVNIDKTAPSVVGVGSPSPAPNAYGWNNSPVTLLFKATDALSGVDGPDEKVFTLSNEGPDQAVQGEFSDRAGNVGQARAGMVNIDMTGPYMMTGQWPQANSNGWNNSDVWVYFHGVDLVSGMASVSSPVAVRSEGAGQTATGEGVDVAGNVTPFTLTNINIDKTAPAVSAAGGANPPPNAEGWNNTPVTMLFRASDSLSGIDGPDQQTFTLSDEGRDQSVQAEFSDLAGNRGQAMAGSINIDLTEPALTSTRSPLPNANGWNKEDVTVSFAGSDLLSGLASVSEPVVVSTEGAAQTATGHGADVAGNTASLTISDINIDKTAPMVSAAGGANPPPNANGWNNGPVTMLFHATDAVSGINGPDEQSFTLAGEGPDQSVQAEFSDLAGNVGQGTAGSINIDLTAPTMTYTRTPLPNRFGWNYEDVIVTFAGEDALSGLASVSPRVRRDAEGAGQTAIGVALDLAGNATETTVTGINIDKTQPVVTVSEPDPAPNAHGWNNTPVTVHFFATDELSGVEGPAETSRTLEAEGRDQWTGIDVGDLAGNVGRGYTPLINIDRTAPTIVSVGSPSPAPNSNGWNNTPVTVLVTAADALSGIDGPEQQTFSFSTEGLTQMLQANVLDLAGNATNAAAGPVNIDLTAPAVTITSPNAGPYLTSQVLVIDYDATDALSGVRTIGGMIDQTPVADGQSIPLTNLAGAHTFTVQAEDQAGNQASAAQPFVVEIDATVDLQPKQLRNRAEKVMTLYLEFASPYSVQTIQPDSVTLTPSGGVAVPVVAGSAVIGDYDRDGIEDMALNVDAGALVKAVGTMNGTIPLRVTGSTSTATFAGNDIVIVK